jgi:hypothetical protein
MQGDQPHALAASIIVGVALAATGILADDLFSHRLRIGMAVIGCCVLLIGIVWL